MDNYQLIFINFDNTINIVNKNIWSNMTNNTTDGWYLTNNISNIITPIKPYKITQLHNGNFLYIDSKLDLYTCDNNFLNSKRISNGVNKFSGVTQLSNYQILLTGIINDKNIYTIKTLTNFKVQASYTSSNFFTDVKQINNGKILAISDGNTYSFDMNNIFGRTNTNNIILQNLILLTFNNNYSNLTSTFIPGNPQTFIFNLDDDYLRQAKIYTYNSNSNNISNRDSRCIDGYQFDGINTCYQICPSNYYRVNSTCWGSCKTGENDNISKCQVPCETNYYDTKAGSCYYGNGNVDLYPFSFTRTTSDTINGCDPNYTKIGTECMNCPAGYAPKDDNINCYNTSQPYIRSDPVVPIYGNCSEDLVNVQLANDKCTGYIQSNCSSVASINTNGVYTCPNTNFFFRGTDKTKCWFCGNSVTLSRIPSCPAGKQLQNNNTQCYDIPRTDYTCIDKNCQSVNSSFIKCTNYRNINKTCPAGKRIENNKCYDIPPNGYNCTDVNCLLNNYKPVVYNKPTITLNQGINVNNQQYNYIRYSILNGCSPCDLTFYNTLYYKPTTMIIPNIPITNNLFAYYDASSFANNIWYDLTSNNNHAVYNNGNIKVNGNYIYGDINSNILFPCEILPPEYTLLHICRYNGTNNGSILYGFDSEKSSWYSGFYKNKSGVAYHGGNVTQNNLSIFNNKWVFSTDTNTSYRANGRDYTNNNTFNSYAQLAINNNLDSTNNSDWAVACIIVFNKNLSSSEINSMEFWLTNKYPDLWNLIYSQPYSNIGYSCNPINNKIGRIINNYSEYEYVTDNNNNTVDCEWLPFPPQNLVNKMICPLPSNIPPVPTNITSVPTNITSVPTNITSVPTNITSVPTNITSMPTNITSVPNETNNKELYKNNICMEAYNYYNLYPSNVPIVIKGNDANYSIQNKIDNTELINNISNKNTNAFSQIIEGFDNNINNYYKY